MPARSRPGDARDGFAAADLGVDATFRFAPNHHNALEPITPHAPRAAHLRAQFARVAVDADLGTVRVRHMADAFAPGRVLNPRATRGQPMGGML